MHSTGGGAAEGYNLHRAPSSVSAQPCSQPQLSAPDTVFCACKVAFLIEALSFPWEAILPYQWLIATSSKHFLPSSRLISPRLLSFGFYRLLKKEKKQSFLPVGTSQTNLDACMGNKKWFLLRLRCFILTVRVCQASLLLESASPFIIMLFVKDVCSHLSVGQFL